MPDLSPEAKERARRAIMVAAVFDEHAEEIEAAVVDVGDGELLVAVVDAQHEFAGLHRVGTADLIERVAGRLLGEMFRTFPVDRVVVRVAKPEAPIGGLNQAIEVQISRTRKQWEEQTRVQQSGYHGQAER